ncbi:RNA-dependent RNA polymerase 2 [Platanthera zijinensis]|uniref:RNA-dependent RNA polymerase n=1 Tax=Platanthera zijinensis TaxID=2320716 RepID=A0AAP0BZN6_9ASPA
MLNITSYSKYLPGYLNREIISLLSSLGVEDAVFGMMQSDQISLLDNMLINREAALALYYSISVLE